eukprot:TRINITY_DN311_c0_g1_i4.p1 TRINITY_DN311_c0_g1~~TRINITY_DN311_c0_g1_i4.p1  ORF type:complete len:1193 (+),score=388.02 TRINITY_DN311_c0_g1_i4:123-3701(+)
MQIDKTNQHLYSEFSHRRLLDMLDIQDDLITVKLSDNGYLIESNESILGEMMLDLKASDGRSEGNRECALTQRYPGLKGTRRKKKKKSRTLSDDRGVDLLMMEIEKGDEKRSVTLTGYEIWKRDREEGGKRASFAADIDLGEKNETRRRSLKRHKSLNGEEEKRIHSAGGSRRKSVRRDKTIADDEINYDGKEESGKRKSMKREKSLKRAGKRVDSDEGSRRKSGRRDQTIEGDEINDDGKGESNGTRRRSLKRNKSLNGEEEKKIESDGGSRRKSIRRNKSLNGEDKSIEKRKSVTLTGHEIWKGDGEEELEKRASSTIAEKASRRKSQKKKKTLNFEEDQDICDEGDNSIFRREPLKTNSKLNDGHDQADENHSRRKSMKRNKSLNREDKNIEKDEKRKSVTLTGHEIWKGDGEEELEKRASSTIAEKASRRKSQKKKKTLNFEEDQDICDEGDNSIFRREPLKTNSKLNDGHDQADENHSRRKSMKRNKSLNREDKNIEKDEKRKSVTLTGHEIWKGDGEEELEKRASFAGEIDLDKSDAVRRRSLKRNKSLNGVDDKKIDSGNGDRRRSMKKNKTLNLEDTQDPDTSDAGDNNSRKSQKNRALNDDEEDGIKRRKSLKRNRILTEDTDDVKHKKDSVETIMLNDVPIETNKDSFRKKSKKKKRSLSDNKIFNQVKSPRKRKGSYELKNNDTSNQKKQLKDIKRFSENNMDQFRVQTERPKTKQKDIFSGDSSRGTTRELIKLPADSGKKKKRKSNKKGKKKSSESGDNIQKPKISKSDEGTVKSSNLKGREAIFSIDWNKSNKSDRGTDRPEKTHRPKRNKKHLKSKSNVETVQVTKRSDALLSPDGTVQKVDSLKRMNLTQGKGNNPILSPRELDLEESEDQGFVNSLGGKVENPSSESDSLVAVDSIDVWEEPVMFENLFNPRQHHLSRSGSKKMRKHSSSIELGSAIRLTSRNRRKSSRDPSVFSRRKLNYEENVAYQKGAEVIGIDSRPPDRSPPPPPSITPPRPLYPPPPLPVTANHSNPVDLVDVVSVEDDVDDCIDEYEYETVTKDGVDVQVIIAATFKGIMDEMAGRQQTYMKDYDFVLDILYTYEYLCTAEELLNEIMLRYPHTCPSDDDAMQKKYRRWRFTVKKNAKGVLEIWIKKFFYSFLNAGLLPTVTDFINTQVAETREEWGEELTLLIESVWE